MASGLKRWFLRLCRGSGLFALSKRFYRRKLCILCYHGIQATDEAAWWPGVFVSRDTFARRMALLTANGFNVLGLEEAIKSLKAQTLPANAVVITADDGYENTLTEMQPILAARGFPATVYVTTYYVEHRNPIFRLAVQYMFWCSAAKELPTPPPAWAQSLETSRLETKAQRRAAGLACVEYGEQHCSENQRQALLAELGTQLGVDYEALKVHGGLTLMSGTQIRELSRRGIDVQLHTHRHRFPVEREDALKEIQDNAKVLAPLIDDHPIHFCYPSGKWHSDQHPWLQEAGVASATTCRIGFNDHRTNVYALNRYLDREDITEIEFLSEICGFSPTLRAIRQTVKSVARRPARLGRSR